MRILSKKSLIIAYLLVFICLPAAHAFEIAIIKSKNIADYNAAITGFRVACAERITEYDMEENFDRGHRITAKIKSQKPDIVIAVGVKAAIVARQDISDIPIVFAMVLNPEAYDLKADNVTGISLAIPVRTQLKALRGILPRVKKIGVIYNPKKTSAIINAGRQAASAMGLELVASKIADASDVPNALRLFESGVDAIWMIADSTVVTPQSFSTILNFSFDNRIPFFAFSQRFVQHGALLSLSTNYANIGQQACSIAKKVLNSKAPAGRLPYANPRGLEITFNLKTAKRIGANNIAGNAATFAASEGYKINVTQ
jgi:putative tryptophan/tyrosine transport system substrate-binding protein